MHSPPKVRRLSDRKSNAHFHPVHNVTTAGRAWISATISPKFIWGFLALKKDIESVQTPTKAGMIMALYFENSLGIQLTVGSWTTCPTDNVNLQLYHDSQFTFIIVTPWLWKLYRFWRFKNPFKCWFCSPCGGITVQGLQNVTKPLNLVHSNSTDLRFNPSNVNATDVQSAHRPPSLVGDFVKLIQGQSVL
jgi:hypothetical protein